MDAERWTAINRIFHGACDLPPGEREEYIRSATAGDESLADAVRSLLDNDASADGALAGVVLGAVDRLAGWSEPGERIGAYRVLRRIGEGGMGAVYLAVRDDGEFEQQVALKLIRPGLDTEQILRRFRAERQILARLQHPNIARLLDGGVTTDGRPYFAMEYVDGVRIDEYCRAHQLDVDDRLALFADVCAAVIHAHAQLVVHRDLKPANILVNSNGEVRLLDFGLARVVEDTETAELTQFGERALTPAYASPEQVRGEAAGTATDVYALGVILYELLSGVRPYEVAGRAPAEVERAIVSTVPLPPSARVAERAAGSGTEGADPHARTAASAGLRRRLAGDLDVICMKALRKEPDRRYSSVEALLADIRRHRTGFPVSARPDSAGYRASRFITRHRTGVAAAVGVFLLTATLVVFYTVRLTNARDEARIEAARADQTADFLRGLFAESDPRETGDGSVTARELLDAGAERIEHELDGQPELRASMMQLIGDIYATVGLNQRSRSLLERALAEQRRIHGPTHADVATTLMMLGVVNQSLGDLTAADSLLEQARSMREQLFGSSHNDVLEVLHHSTNVRQAQGDLTGAIELAREVLARERAREPVDPRWLSRAAVRLGETLVEIDEVDEAEPLLREGLALQRQAYGARDMRVAGTARNLGSLLRRRGRLEEAEPFIREALDIRRRVLGELHPDYVTTLATHAMLLADMGASDSAVASFHTVIDLERRTSGGASSNLAAFHSNLGWALRGIGRMEDAARQYAASIAVQNEVLPDDHPNRAHPRMALAGLYMSEGRWAEAEPLLREAVAVRRAGLPEGHRLTGEALSALGECLGRVGRTAEAESALAEAQRILEADEGPDGAGVQRTRERIQELRSGGRVTEG